MATAKDARSQRVDPLACGDAIDPPELAVPPDAGGSACNVSVSVETDLLDIVVKHPGNGVSVVAVKGELDVLTAPLLGDCLLEEIAAAPAHLIVDLQTVRFLGSSGLNCLLDARELVQRFPPMQLHLAGLVTRAVARPLRITGLLDRFDTYPTVADALTALTG